VDNAGFESPTHAIWRIFFLPFAIVAVLCAQYFTFATEIFFLARSKARRDSNRKEIGHGVYLPALLPFFKKSVSRHNGRRRRCSARYACMRFMCATSEETGASRGENGRGEKNR